MLKRFLISLSYKFFLLFQRLQTTKNESYQLTIIANYFLRRVQWNPGTNKYSVTGCSPVSCKVLFHFLALSFSEFFPKIQVTMNGTYWGVYTDSSIPQAPGWVPVRYYFLFIYIRKPHQISYYGKGIHSIISQIDFRVIPMMSPPWTH